MVIQKSLSGKFSLAPGCRGLNYGELLSKSKSFQQEPAASANRPRDGAKTEPHNVEQGSDKIRCRQSRSLSAPSDAAPAAVSAPGLLCARF